MPATHVVNNVVIEAGGNLIKSAKRNIAKASEKAGGACLSDTKKAYKVIKKTGKALANIERNANSIVDLATSQIVADLSQVNDWADNIADVSSRNITKWVNSALRFVGWV